MLYVIRAINTNSGIFYISLKQFLIFFYIFITYHEVY